MSLVWVARHHPTATLKRSQTETFSRGQCLTAPIPSKSKPPFQQRSTGYEQVTSDLHFPPNCFPLCPTRHKPASGPLRSARQSSPVGEAPSNREPRSPPLANRSSSSQLPSIASDHPHRDALQDSHPTSSPPSVRARRLHKAVFNRSNHQTATELRDLHQ